MRFLLKRKEMAESLLQKRKQSHFSFLFRRKLFVFALFTPYVKARSSWSRTCSWRVCRCRRGCLWGCRPRWDTCFTPFYNIFVQIRILMMYMLQAGKIKLQHLSVLCWRHNEYLFISAHILHACRKHGFLQSEMPFMASSNMAFGMPKHGIWHAQTWLFGKTSLCDGDAKNIVT